MTIKQQGGIFGRNPTFNDVDVDGTLTVGGSAVPAGSDIASLSTANEFTQEQEIKVVDATAYDASAADAQVTVGPSLFLNNPANTNSTVAGQVVFGLRSTPYYARLGATGGSNPNIFVGLGTSEIARFTSSGLTFNGDTAAANALDDYEEGTWTPQFSDAGTGGTTTGSGVYVKVGNKVTVHGKIDNIDTTGLTSSNKAYVHGLPFTCTSSSNVLGNVFFSGGVTTSGACFYYIGSSATHGRFFQSPYTGTSDILNVSAFTDDAADILINATYIVS